MSSNNFLVLGEYYSLNISVFKPHHQRAREDGTRPNTANNIDSFSLEDSTMVPSSFEVPCCSTFTLAKKSKLLIYPENKNDPTNVERTVTNYMALIRENLPHYNFLKCWKSHNLVMANIHISQI